MGPWIHRPTHRSMDPWIHRPTHQFWTSFWQRFGGIDLSLPPLLRFGAKLQNLVRNWSRNHPFDLGSRARISTSTSDLDPDLDLDLDLDLNLDVDVDVDVNLNPSIIIINIIILIIRTHHHAPIPYPHPPYRTSTTPPPTGVHHHHRPHRTRHRYRCTARHSIAAAASQSAAAALGYTNINIDIAEATPEGGEQLLLAVQRAGPPGGLLTFQCTDSKLSLGWRLPQEPPTGSGGSLPASTLSARNSISPRGLIGISRSAGSVRLPPFACARSVNSRVSVRANI